MKLRVKHFIREKWTIQKQILGCIWVPVTKAIIFENSPRLSTRHQPLLYDTFEKAVSVATRLSNEEEMKRHVQEQDAIWEKAKASFESKTAEFDKVFEIEQSGR